MTHGVLNRCCPVCLMPFVNGQYVVDTVTYRTSARIGGDASVRLFRHEIAVTYCQGHEPTKENP